MAKSPVTAPVTNGAPAAASVAAVVASTENKKASKAFILYLDKDGKPFNSPVAQAAAMRFEFSNGVKREITPANFKAEILSCATLQGFATRLQRSYQSDKDVDKCIESFDETVADLSNGVWIESKSGAPRVTMLATAVKLSLEASGQSVNDERFAGIVEKLKVTVNVEKAMANEHVKMHLANLKLAAAQERAKEARATAKAAAPVSLADF